MFSSIENRAATIYSSLENRAATRYSSLENRLLPGLIVETTGLQPSLVV